jgi:hypothetical protein
VYCSGASKKSYEKLLVVSYTMRAMGLNRLAETAAALLKTRTGLVLPWCPNRSDTGEDDAGENKEPVSTLDDSTASSAKVKAEGTQNSVNHGGHATDVPATEVEVKGENVVDRNESKCGEDAATGEVTLHSATSTSTVAGRRHSTRVKQEPAPR